MTTTPEQLAKLENEASRAAIEWWQENDSRIGAGRIDAYKAGYLRAKQANEQAMNLAKFGAMVLSAYKEGYVSDEKIGNFALSSRCITKPIEAYEPNIEDTIKELLND